MIISSINSNFNVFNAQKNQQYRRNNLTSDVFIRTTPVFKARGDEKDKSYESFKEWSEKTDFLSKVQDIAERTGRILGSGFEGVIYEIPDTKNWVIKEYKRTNIIPQKTEKPNIEEVKNLFPNLNVGQCIALVNLPCGKNHTTRYYILQKQEGNPLGVGVENANFIEPYYISSHINSLKTLADAPDKTFEQLIDDVKYIHDTGYELDVKNPQNFLYDEKKQKINFVDVNDINNNNSNLYGEVLFALSNNPFSINLMNAQGYDEEKEETKELSGKIAAKYFKAMQKKGVKINESEFFTELLKSPLLDKALNSSEYDEKISNLQNQGLVDF